MSSSRASPPRRGPDPGSGPGLRRRWLKYWGLIIEYDGWVMRRCRRRPGYLWTVYWLVIATANLAMLIAAAKQR